MGLETETKTVERTTEQTYYECDHDECPVRSTWREDLNFVVLNPEIATLTTPGSDRLKYDGVAILCDQHLEAFREHCESFGIDFETPSGLTLEPVSRRDWQ